MKCHQVEEQFSELFEGALSPAKVSELRKHIEACASCTAAYAEFERALSALQGLARRPTQPKVAAAMLGAVDAAAERASTSSADHFQRAVLIAHSEERARNRRALWRGRAAAFLVGAAAVFLLLFFENQYDWFANTESTPIVANNSGETGDLKHDETSKPDRIAQTAIPEPAEPLVAMAPEPEIVIREVVRTVTERVEVPVIVEVERTIDRGPLLVIETTALAGLAEAFIEALETTNQLHAEELLAAALTTPSEAFEEPPSVRAETVLEIPESSYASLVNGPSISIREENGRVQLETRGRLAELVPVLVAQLSDENLEIAAQIQRELEGIRQRAIDDPIIGPQLIEPQIAQASPTTFERIFGRSPDERTVSWEEDWDRWWGANWELLSSAEASGDF